MLNYEFRYNQLHYFAAGTKSPRVIKNIVVETPQTTICTNFRAEPKGNPTKIASTLGLQLMLFCKSILYFIDYKIGLADS